MQTNMLRNTLLLALGLAACASTPPKELADARAAYQQISEGRAAELAPADVHKARLALEEAERAFDEEGDAQVTRDLSYIALRKAQLADIVATREAQARVKSQAEEALAQAEARRGEQTAAQLSQAQQQAEENERKNRELNERLAELAKLREDERGTVLTLSGSLLFPSGSSTLTPEAQRRLEEISQALAQDENRNILVQGFTDSTGSEELNLALSQRRAEAVRQFLVSKGVPPERVQAQGFGEAQPIAPNKSPEGRANNRRVEIVLEPAQGQGAQAPQGTQGAGQEP